MKAQPPSPWRSRLVLGTVVAALLLLLVAIATPNLMESRGYHIVQSEAESPPMRVMSVPAPAAAPESRAKAAYAVAEPQMQLDLPTENSAHEEENAIPKGREEAVADQELGGQRSFMAMGAGGGALPSRRGGSHRLAAPGKEAKDARQIAADDAPAGLAAANAGEADADMGGQGAFRMGQAAQNAAPAAPAAKLRVEKAKADALDGASRDLPPGERLLFDARRAGRQVLPGAGEPVVSDRPLFLDPTQTYGLDPAAFAAAWGTPPMAVVARDARLTFALDESTHSFQRAQADLLRGRWPDAAGIRPEHFINAVPGDYPRPTQEAFQLYAEAGPSLFARGPLAARSALVAVGVVGRDAVAGERRPLRLVLGIDGSGSMGRPGAWNRARLALDGLVSHLLPTDRVAVVAFADRARVVLPAGNDPGRLSAALAGLPTAGATNIGEGLALSCQLAREMAAPGCELRVVLVSDGAAIAGTGEAAAAAWVGGLKAAGGSLMILTVGDRAADAAALEALAKAGDGQLAHLASDDDARRAVEERLLPERLQVLARDAKAQVTWNPERVTHARLVGYERRRLAHADFRRDQVDAGELSAAVTVTALFEVVLAEGGHGPLGTAAVRYLDTRREAVRELAAAMPGALLAASPSPRLRTLACAAELAEQLRGGWWANVRPTPFRAIAAACPGDSETGLAIRLMAGRAADLLREPQP